MKTRNFFTHIFGGVWRILDFIRRVIHLVLMLIVALLVIALFGSRAVIVPRSAALIVNPQGELVEQLSGKPADRAISRLFGREQRAQTRLRDVLEAIDKARADTRIKALVLEPDQLDSASLSGLQAIRQAVDQFKQSGKPVIAYGDSFSQQQYYLAASANRVYMHPEGEILITGYGAYRDYFKDALDKLGVDWNVFRVGEYKSFVEPFTRNNMSPQAREANLAWLKVLWNAYQTDVTAARKLKSGSVAAYVDDLVSNLRDNAGDAARVAVKAGFVDRLETRDELRGDLSKIVGENSSTHSFNQIDFSDYLAAVDGDASDSNAAADPGVVGVIIASGDIEPGDRPPGEIGAKSMTALIQQARYDNSVKAVVLRVDSPGGSAFASDVILRDIELLRGAGKPVVVSMGGVAASGGYWISMAGDEIWARPTTITGSIGILGMFPTFQRTLAKIGIHSDGVGTTPLSGAFRLDQPLNDNVKRAFQLSIEHGYQVFISKVAHYRHMSVAAVDKIARGRVWSGLDAKQLGLVDKLGGLSDAVKSAARLAGLGNRYSVRYIEKPLSVTERLLISMSRTTRAVLGSFDLGGAWLSPKYRELLVRLNRETNFAARFHDPKGLYAYCFCELSGN